MGSLVCLHGEIRKINLKLKLIIFFFIDTLLPANFISKIIILIFNTFNLELINFLLSK